MSSQGVYRPTPLGVAVRRQDGLPVPTASVQRPGCAAETRATLSRAALSWAALAACFFAVLPGCGARGIDAVRGSVTLDGQPLEMGALHLQPEGAADGPTAGGTVADGAFELLPPQPLPPGRYAAHLTATRRSGRMVRDPQRGEVAELVSLEVADTPKSVEVTAATAGSLQLEFVTRSR